VTHTLYSAATQRHLQSLGLDHGKPNLGVTMVCVPVFFRARKNHQSFRLTYTNLKLGASKLYAPPVLLLNIHMTNHNR
jgi:hypothetical protein